MTESTIEKVKACISKHPDWNNARVTKNFSGARVADIAAIRVSMNPGEQEESAGALSGIKLGASRVSRRRPADNAKSRIKELPTGRGFSVSDLSKSWGFAESGILKCAREMGCLRYVEVKEDDWKQLIMSPLTAAQYDV